MSDEQEKRSPIVGSAVRITRLDAEGNPIGDETPEFTRIVDETPEFTRIKIDVTFLPTSRMVLGLMLGHRWAIDPVLIAMGAEWEFDYADLPSDEQSFESRITRCYEIAAHAIVNTDAVRNRAEAEQLPMPEALIHGKWSSPDTRDKPIHHAWVLLDDGRIWEPISRTIHDTEEFTRYTQCVSNDIYSPEAAAANMLRTGHYGRWF